MRTEKKNSRYNAVRDLQTYWKSAVCVFAQKTADRRGGQGPMKELSLPTWQSAGEVVFGRATLPSCSH